MSQLRIAIVLNKTRWNARLCRFFTGCYAYHAAFADLDTGRMYDMHLIRRRRRWLDYSAKRDVELYPSPVSIPSKYFEDQLDDDTSRYGLVDYYLFSVRWLFHLFGKSTRNAGGVICSEMVNNDLRANGCDTPWKSEDAPPSPCDLRRWLLTLKGQS